MKDVSLKTTSVTHSKNVEDTNKAETAPLHPILKLQGTVGNRVVQQMINESLRAKGLDGSSRLKLDDPKKLDKNTDSDYKNVTVRFNIKNNWSAVKILQEIVGEAQTMIKLLKDGLRHIKDKGVVEQTRNEINELENVKKAASSWSSFSDKNLDILIKQTALPFLLLEDGRQYLVKLAIDLHGINIKKHDVLSIHYNEKKDTTTRKVEAGGAMVIVLGSDAFESSQSLHNAILKNIKGNADKKNDENKQLQEDAVKFKEINLSEALKFNNNILKDNLSIKIIQDITGSRLTGIFDENAVIKIAEFQERNSEKATGKIDYKTMELLFNDLREKSMYDAAIHLIIVYFGINKHEKSLIDIHYSNNITDGGNAEASSSGKKGPTIVKIGPRQFENFKSCVSTIMHEMEHVGQNEVGMEYYLSEFIAESVEIMNPLYNPENMTRKDFFDFMIDAKQLEEYWESNLTEKDKKNQYNLFRKTVIKVNQVLDHFKDSKEYGIFPDTVEKYRQYMSF